MLPYTGRRYNLPDTFPDPLQKVVRGSCHMGRGRTMSTVIAFSKSRTQVSDSSVHMNYYTARFTEMVCRDRQVTISNLVHHVHTRLSLLQCDWSSQIPEHGQETPLRTPDPLCTCTRVRDPRLRPKLNRDGLGMGSALACGGLGMR